MRLTLINLLSGVTVDIIDAEYSDDGIYGHELDDNGMVDRQPDFYPYSKWAIV